MSLRVLNHRGNSVCSRAIEAIGCLLHDLRRYGVNQNARILLVLGTFFVPLGLLCQCAQAGYIAGPTTLYVSTTDRNGVTDSDSTTLQVEAPNTATALVGTIPGSYRISDGVGVLHDTSAGTVRFYGGYNRIPDAHVSGRIEFNFTLDAVEDLVVGAARGGDHTSFGPGAAIITNATTGQIVDSHGFDGNLEHSFNLSPGSYLLEIGYELGASALGGLLLPSEFVSVYEWGFGGLSGETLDLPIYPTIIDSDGFGFTTITNTDLRYYDPVIATGYNYSTSDVPFASVLVPTALPGGDSEFELLVGSDSYQLFAGQEFDFTSFYSGGVQDFSIIGIDPGELLDPDDPTAFITGLSFTQGGQISEFTMAPITTTVDPSAVPEPSSLVLLTLGGLGFAAAAVRSKPRRNRISKLADAPSKNREQLI